MARKPRKQQPADDFEPELPLEEQTQTPPPPQGQTSRELTVAGADGVSPSSVATAAALEKKRRKKKRSSNASDSDAYNPDRPRVVYVGRIPHGFYEDQMRGFFEQFGTVTRLRVSRNKKTGHSKHYGFVEFESPDVAAIVAECMHNYLIAGHILQTRLLPPSHVHPRLWEGANRKFRLLPTKRVARESHNRVRTPKEQRVLVKRQLRSETLKRRKLAAAGVDYDFDGLRKHVQSSRPLHKRFDGKGSAATAAE